MTLRWKGHLVFSKTEIPDACISLCFLTAALAVLAFSRAVSAALASANPENIVHHCLDIFIDT